MTTVVLGCTHYELVAERIRAAVQRPGRPPLVLHGSAGAVAAQALRRIGAQPAPGGRGHRHPHGAAQRPRGRALPDAAPSAYAEGRLLRHGRHARRADRLTAPAGEPPSGRSRLCRDERTRHGET